MSQANRQYSNESRITGSYTEIPIFEEDVPVKRGSFSKPEEDAPTNRTPLSKRESRLSRLETMFKNKGFYHKSYFILTLVGFFLTWVLIFGSYFYTWKQIERLEQKIINLNQKTDYLEENHEELFDEIEIKFINLEEGWF